MPVSAEEFKEKITSIVRAHYACNRMPLLLAHLGAEIEKENAWPTDRNHRSLKQLLTDYGGPDLEIVRDKRSPAYIAVVTPDVRAQVEEQIAQRVSGEAVSVRLEEISRPVLLAFCVQVHSDAPVYVRRSRPFRYQVGSVLPEEASDFVIVESEFRRPGLRVDRPDLLALADRRDLESRIQRWAVVHDLKVDQFSKHDQNDKETADSGKTALDRLLAAQPQDVAHGRAERFLKKLAGPYAKVIAIASGTVDGALFRRATVDSLLRAGSEFAIRRLQNRNDDELPRPRRISLLYIPAEDDENLLSAFDFFVFPIPMRDLSLFDGVGRQRRHDSNACERAIQAAFDKYQRDLPVVVQRRVESRRSSEPLLLPPVNFHTPSGNLGRMFSELTRGTRSWENAKPNGVIAEIFDYERLPGFLREQERQEIYRDSRSVVFPCARANELHGRPAEINHPPTLADLQYFLRSVYRFGAPLPEGFHHDAQLEDGRHFNNMNFVCAREGPILVSGNHANVYPNDFVRAVI